MRVISGIGQGQQSQSRVKLGDFAARLGFGLRRAGSLYQIHTPDRLLLAPQELRASDPTTATDIYSGHFIFAGRTVLTRGESPFAIASPSPAWTRELLGFDWLRHFRDTDNMVVREHGRALVAEWLDLKDSQRDAAAGLPSVTARRVLSWLVNSPVLLAGANHDFYRTFLRALARDASHLENVAALRSTGSARLTAAIAYASYTLCALTAENDWKRASRLLAMALTETILPDGCHISRNPRDAIEAAIDLLPLRNAYTARGRMPPAELQTALDRIMMFVRMMRHPDGQIALFNGMGSTPLDLVGALFAFDDTNGEAALHAPYGGYQRLDHHRSTLIVDCGGVPPKYCSQEAHAGALAFEFSAGYERIIVNCGSAPGGLDAIREALRETAAHSTLSVEGVSSARFRARRLPDGSQSRPLQEAGKPPTCLREADVTGETLSLRQSGYLKAYGFAHERTLALAADGQTLQGIDRVTAAASRKRPVLPPARLRFHLHPQVLPELAADGGTVRLHLADGTVWLFEASGTRITIEESIFFGGMERQRQTYQLVLAVMAHDTELRWSLSRTNG